MDLDTIIDKTRVTLKRSTKTYDDHGYATETWADAATADVEIQPLSPVKASAIAAAIGENGQVELYSHAIYCYYDTSGTKLTIAPGERFYDTSGKFYEIKQVKEFLNSHYEVYAVFVEGKA